jgi:hypothetical protein
VLFSSIFSSKKGFFELKLAKVINNENKKSASTAARIGGKPTLAHPFGLLKNLANAPQRRKGKYARHGGKKRAFAKKRYDSTQHAQQKKRYPRARAKVVLCLDNQRVKQPDGEKSSQANGQAGKIFKHDFCF